MRGSNDQSRGEAGDAAIWALVRRQHGVVARRQLLELGLQMRGLKRDQTHLAAGMWPLRFSHWQIKHERGHVQSILRSAVARARATPQALD